MKRWLGVFLIAFFMCGCATTGKRIETEKVQQIKEGITTEKEVIDILGSPYMKTLGSDGKIIMVYQYTKVKNRAQNFIPIVGLLAGGMDMDQQMLTVLIGKDGKVEKYTFNDSNSPINSGLFNTR